MNILKIPQHFTCYHCITKMNFNGPSGKVSGVDFSLCNSFRFSHHKQNTLFHSSLFNFGTKSQIGELMQWIMQLTLHANPTCTLF